MALNASLQDVWNSCFPPTPQQPSNSQINMLSPLVDKGNNHSLNVSVM